MRMTAPATSVLVVDPDAAAQHQIMACLGGRYHLLTAARLSEALRFITQAQPRALIVEVDQPDGDGIQLIEQLRSNPATKSMIVICVTTRRAVQDKVRGFQAGADDYIIKPIDPETFPIRLALLERVRRLTT
jgi:DNA-binding response OmpR family regulator